MDSPYLTVAANLLVTTCWILLIWYHGYQSGYERSWKLLRRPPSVKLWVYMGKLQQGSLKNDFRRAFYDLVTGQPPTNKDTEHEQV